MNESLRVQLDNLKDLSSEDAAEWLMQTFPLERADYATAFDVIRHRSWKRKEQVRLALFYLRKVPFANSMPYEVFASVMSVSTFIGAIREAIPESSSDRQLLRYHLAPVLRKHATSALDIETAEKFLQELI